MIPRTPKGAGPSWDRKVDRPKRGYGRWNPNHHGGDLQVQPVLRCPACGIECDRSALERGYCNQCPPPVSVVDEWWYDGNCKQSDEATHDEVAAAWARFFPDQGGSATVARAICNGCTAERAVQLGIGDPANPQPVPECPVRQECLAYAVRHAIPHGIWGGRNDAERRRIRYQERAKLYAEAVECAS